MEEQKDQKTEFISIQCGVEIPQNPLLGENLTVGREFLLKCKNPGVDVDWSKATLLPAKSEDQFKVRLLKAQNSSEGVELLVTSYRVGNHQIEKVILASQDKVFSIDNLNFSVQSVQDPQNPQKEPFGPFGPFALTVPVLYWAILAGIALLLLGGLAWRLKAYFKRKRFLEDLATKESSLSPLAEISQSIRKMQRQYKVLNNQESNPEEIKLVTQELETAYRIYMSRVFRIPTEGVPLKQVFKLAFKFNPKLAKAVQSDVASLHREVEHVHKDLTKLQGKDCIQLMQQIRKLADHINRQKHTGAKP